ncbi:MAG: MFS transporter [Pseudomonadota bacterium]
MRGIFYGWWVLLGLFLIYTANNGILMHTLPLFYPALTEEFGWNQEQVTQPASYLFILAAFLTPFMGALFDRFSTRLIMVFGIAAVVLPLAFYSRISSLGELTVIYLVGAVGLAGSGLMPNMLILTRWFRRYRGRAVGILLMGSSLGGALFPLVAGETLAEQGWREASQLIAVIGAVMMVVAIALLVRNRPEDMGLAPDGDPEPTAALDAASAAATAGPTLGDAVRTPAFYLLLFATGGMWFCIVGIIQHQSLYFGDDLGVDTATLARIFSAFFWSAIVGKLLFGFLADRFDKTLVMLASVFNLTIGLLILRHADPTSSLSLYGYAVVYGIGFSGAFAAIQLVIADFFAGASYGKILGVFTMVDSIAGAMGIQYLGAQRVADGNYLQTLNEMIGLTLVIAAVVGALYLIHARQRRAR